MTHQEEKVLQEGRQETTNISILLNDLVFSFKYHLRRFNMSSFLIFKTSIFFHPGLFFIHSKHITSQQFTLEQNSLNIYMPLIMAMRELLGIQPQFLSSQVFQPLLHNFPFYAKIHVAKERHESTPHFTKCELSSLHTCREQPLKVIERWKRGIFYNLTQCDYKYGLKITTME